MKAEPQWMALRWWVGLLVMVLAGPAYSVVNVSGLTDLDLGFWSPALGDAQGSNSFCVQSTTGGGAPRDYRVRMLASNFELTNTTDASQTIPFRIYYEDLFTPSSQQLNPSSWSSQDKQGVADCAPLQLNGGLLVEIDQIDLAAVSAGTYQGTLRMMAQSRGLAFETLNIQIVIGEMAWIQNLDPIALNYTVGSDAVGNEPFCIWSTTGAYDITINSQSPTATTTFLAPGQIVPANSVNFGVQFDTDADASDGATVTEGALITNQSPADSSSPPSCLADNAAIHVNFPEAGNLGVAPADIYADELTVVIEPR